MGGGLSCVPVCKSHRWENQHLSRQAESRHHGSIRVEAPSQPVRGPHRPIRPVVDPLCFFNEHSTPKIFSCFLAQGAEGVDVPVAQGAPVCLPLLLIPDVIRRMLLERADLLLVAPHGPQRLWFANLVCLSVARPWRILPDRVALNQGPVLHLVPQQLQLAMRHLSGCS